MPPARPTSAGTSKDSKARMKISSIRAMIPGIASLTVMWRKVWEMPAPLIIDASSKEASVERNTDDSSRNARGAKPTPSIRIMPHME